jgi:acyl carrier protein
MADKVQEVFAAVLRVDPESLTDGSTPENTANWDSLNALRLVSAIEETFDVQLSTREIVKMRSLAVVREVLRKKGVDV